MFDVNNFLMKTIKGMIGNYPDFQVREYALGWWSKGKLTDDDMVEIDTLIEAQHITDTTEELTENEGETTVDEEVSTEEIETPTEPNNETTE